MKKRPSDKEVDILVVVFYYLLLGILLTYLYTYLVFTTMELVHLQTLAGLFILVATFV